MKWSAAVLGLAASAAADVGILKPDSSAPEGCSASFDGKFQVSVYSLGASKRDVPKGVCGGEGTLIMTLKDGVLLDSKDRTGSIVANYQFQFDGPPQAGAIYTAGFSLCNNGSLALGSSTVFYRCLSGDFYNLYDRSWAEQCSPIEIVATSCDAGSNTGSNGNSPKPVATSMVPNAVVTVIADGQPQLHTTAVPVPMCQIGDGQVQDKTVPCASIPPVQQIGDGQIQGHTAVPPISQIGDGQIQAPKTAAPPPPISQITDGQIQAPVQTSAPGASTPENSQAQPPTGTGAPTQSQDRPTSTPASPTAGAEKIFPGFAAAAAAIFFGLLL